MPHQYNESQVARFWSKVDKRGPDDCWIWTGMRHAYGYGMFSPKHGQSHKTAHRVAWEIANDQAIANSSIHACHHCDNPPCVNPSHIFIGTAADNVADKVKKGRQLKGPTHPFTLRPWLAARGENSGMRKHPERAAWGDRNGSRVHREKMQRGTDRFNARLNEDLVREIRNEVASGASVNGVAIRRGLGRSTVHAVVHRRSWKHVE